MKDISKFISPLLLVFSILLLAYIFYRSELYHSGTKLDYYLKYYIISGAIITFSIASFFIQKDIIDVNFQELFTNYKIDTIINFAAQTHVDNSYSSLNPFIIHSEG